MKILLLLTVRFHQRQCGNKLTAEPKQTRTESYTHPPPTQWEDNFPRDKEERVGAIPVEREGAIDHTRGCC